MIVVVIIGILAAIAIPIFAKQQEAAMQASVKSDVKNAVTAVATWSAKNGGRVPTNCSTSTDLMSTITVSKGNIIRYMYHTDGSYTIRGNPTAWDDATGESPTDTRVFWRSATGKTYLTREDLQAGFSNEAAWDLWFNQAWRVAAIDSTGTILTNTMGGTC